MTEIPTFKLPDLLRAIKERCDAATRGPITIFRDPAGVNQVLLCDAEKHILAKVIYEFCDAELFAHASTDIPLLLRLVELQEKEIAVMRKQLEPLVNNWDIRLDTLDEADAIRAEIEKLLEVK